MSPDGMTCVDLTHSSARRATRGAQWSRMLRGDAPADLWKLRHLDAAWQRVFFAKLADAHIRQMWDDLTGDLKMVRSELRSVVTRKDEMQG